MKYINGLNKKVLLILLFIAVIILSGCCCFPFQLEIITSGLPDGKVGINYDAWVQANQSVDQWSISSGSLPLGISFTANGHFIGSPTVAGLYNFTVEAVKYGMFSKYAHKGLSILINP